MKSKNKIIKGGKHQNEYDEDRNKPPKKFRSKPKYQHKNYWLSQEEDDLEFSIFPNEEE